MGRFRFTADGAGCYADASFGHQHCRDRLAQLVSNLSRRSLGVWLDETLCHELRGEMSDDASEEQEALDILNEHTTGATWEFVDGDLMLTADESEENT